MREILVEQISHEVERLCLKACKELPDDVEKALQRARDNEKSELAKFMLDQILKNAEIARQQGWPLCQDTGMTVVFLEVGQNVVLVGEDVCASINSAVKRAYQMGPFRKSVVAHPLARKNTGDNTPAIIHYEIVAGDQVTISVLPKGFGSENMSRVYMLTPASGRDEVLDLIVQTVKEAGGNPCPPVIVGVGLGGTMDYAALLAKKALLRPLAQPNQDQLLAEMEREALRRINALGIGPLGVGGNTTALAVHINSYPTHIAGLPLAINLQCHSARWARVVI